MQNMLLHLNIKKIYKLLITEDKCFMFIKVNNYSLKFFKIWYEYVIQITKKFNLFH